MGEMIVGAIASIIAGVSFFLWADEK